MGAPTAPAATADVDDTTAAAAVTSDTSDDAGAATVDGTITVTLCSPQSLVLLTMLPFCNICGFLWIYTALPLHFLNSGWALWKLSTLLTVAYIPRVAMTTVTAHVGDWICVPVSATAAVLNLNLLLHPESLAAVWAAVTATCAALNPPAYRSLVYARFLVGPKEQLRRALRIFTLADTLGYACAPFLGGLLYDGGGLRAGAGFATATCAVGGLLPLGLDECRASFREFWHRGMCAGAQAAAKDEKDRSGPPREEKELEEAAKARGGNSVPANGSVPISEHGGTRAATAVVMGAAFVNIFVYGVEWCLYALYFHLEYGWSGAWCGLAQMAGDLIAASVLGASTVAGAAAVLGRFWPRPPRLARALARPPHSLALLALLPRGAAGHAGSAPLRGGPPGAGAHGDGVRFLRAGLPGAAGTVLPRRPPVLPPPGRGALLLLHGRQRPLLPGRVRPLRGVRRLLRRVLRHLGHVGHRGGWNRLLLCEAHGAHSSGRPGEPCSRGGMPRVGAMAGEHPRDLKWWVGRTTRSVT